MTAPVELPRWADVALVPLLTVAAAFAVSGLVVLAIGESPLEVLRILLRGAFGDAVGIGYTLYFTTSFILAGLAVTLAFRAGLFNIGGEGQATLGGLGAVLAIFALEGWSAWVVLPAAILAAALFGGLWGAIPGWLQARRGSHIVITTIMFNFLAATLMVYLLVNVMNAAGQMAPETRPLPEAGRMPALATVLAPLGISLPRSPLNLAFPLALLAAVALWIFIERTRAGYEIRVVGASTGAAIYAGVSPARAIVLAMALSGALAGLLAVNVVMGDQHRLILDFASGAGFVGIAVALMGRGHPLGTLPAALLFGVLYQGGAELAFEKPTITRDMVVVIQGLVILFAGALEHSFRKPLARLLRPKEA